jgi:hypothetical protein
MTVPPIIPSLELLLSEIVMGTNTGGGFVLNTGDRGLLRSLELLSASQASASANGGATIAAHAQHLRYGLSLMNRWAREGGDPFSDALWDEAWRTTNVSDEEWEEIRKGLVAEAQQWLDAVRTPRTMSSTELTGIVASIAHAAYHLGAIRQIDRTARGPKEGTFDRSAPAS